ncbi:hypothetical protein [Amnibacterium kyonggiense]|uniref:Uncharacterized protein n=1 Tax=Amnibacterium kyonggiense TaxID=595671 RepID=A0A4R7FEZ9_9MICO|nr:hypothetical protein [Amnibacterium kyonggiense]TDS75919.1 hypothetical protein CLV52_3030 [Amnibacterium kyonggiense]
MADVHYVRNEIGHVHSVDHDHFENVLHDEVRGRKFMRPGVTEITEAEARKANPQLFGARDRNIVHTAKELQEKRARRQLEIEMGELDIENE